MVANGVWLAACGARINADSGHADGSVDALASDATRSDVTRDGPADAATDATRDAARDATPDTATDATPEAAVDASDVVAACATGEARCGGRCVDTQTDRAHCGACDRACDPGFECSAGACARATLRITSLATTGCIVSADHDDLTLSAGAGFAFTPGRVLFNTEYRTLILDEATLGSPAIASRRNESLLNDLRAEVAYVMADAAGTPISDYSVGSGVMATQLIELDGRGELTPRRIPLSLPVPADREGGMLYSGYGRAIVAAHNPALPVRERDWYVILLPSGEVQPLGAHPIPPAGAAASYIGWLENAGVAEYFGGEHYVVNWRYLGGVRRYRVRDGEETTLLAVTDGFVSSVAFSPRLGRWFFHVAAGVHSAPAFTGITGYGHHVVSCPGTFDQP